MGDATNQSSVISATASLVSADKDVISGTFAPGGNYNKRVFSDWHWTVNLQGSNLGANEAKHIQSMTLYHALGGEGWSTSGSPNNDLGKGLYPLLVIGKGYQNTAYDQDIALSDLSQSNPNFSFDIWGQPESTRFYGGRLVIKFTDGTSVTAQIPSSTITPSTTTSTGAVWDSIRSLFGF